MTSLNINRVKSTFDRENDLKDDNCIQLVTCTHLHSAINLHTCSCKFHHKDFCIIIYEDNKSKPVSEKLYQ